MVLWSNFDDLSVFEELKEYVSSLSCLNFVLEFNPSIAKCVVNLKRADFNETLSEEVSAVVTSHQMQPNRLRDQPPKIHVCISSPLTLAPIASRCSKDKMDVSGSRVLIRALLMLQATSGPPRNRRASWRYVETMYFF